MIDIKSGTLSFNPNDCFVNILRLRINIRTIEDLPFLFTALPNLQSLDVTIVRREKTFIDFDKMVIPTLIHLIDFQFRSTARRWSLEELFVILSRLPSIQRVSFFLATDDPRLVQRDMLLSLFLSTIQEFHYAVYYMYDDAESNQDEEIVASWLLAQPITCITFNNYSLIHTVPWQFTRAAFLQSNRRLSCSQSNGYDEQIEILEISISENYSLPKFFEIISLCSRVREIRFWMRNGNDIVSGEKSTITCLPKLSQLHQIYLYGLIPLDIDYLLKMFIAAPNLSRLNLPFDYLMRLLENEQMCVLLRQRITSVSIDTATQSSQITLNESHITIIASIFTSLRYLYVDLVHLLPSTKITPNNDGSEDLLIRSCLKKCNIIMPQSTESMILCLLKEFKEHKLVEICLGGRFDEMLESNAKEWLQAHTILREQPFDAMFMKDLEQLFIWM